VNKSSTWVIIGVIVLVLIVGYLGRHQIKSMMSGAQTATPATNESTAPSASTMTEASSSPQASPLNNSIVTTRTDPSKGAFLADIKGMTLYTYDKDTTGVSNCYGGCAKAWPIYTATTTTDLPSDFTVVKRTDGTSIYAYEGKPLYYYVQDTKPDDITGDGVGGVWHLVKP
jgi:predicted lipoprotein with Yx(FWY)xxD motif